MSGRGKEMDSEFDFSDCAWRSASGSLGKIYDIAGRHDKDPREIFAMAEKEVLAHRENALKEKLDDGFYKIMWFAVLGGIIFLVGASFVWCACKDPRAFGLGMGGLVLIVAGIGALCYGNKTDFQSIDLYLAGGSLALSCSFGVLSLASFGADESFKTEILISATALLFPAMFCFSIYGGISFARYYFKKKQTKVEEWDKLHRTLTAVGAMI